MSGDFTGRTPSTSTSEGDTVNEDMRPARTVVRFTVDVLLNEDVDTSDVTYLEVTDVVLPNGQLAGAVIQTQCQEARLVVSDG